MRELSKTDLFFLFVYVLKNEWADSDWWFEKCNIVYEKPDGMLDLWARGHGKALALDTKVPTPNGVVEHGRLIPGDYVYGPDGFPTKIIARSQVWDDTDCFEITLDTGYKVKASGEHLWEIQTRSRKRIDGEKREGVITKVVNTRELADLVNLADKSSYNYHPTINVANPIAEKVKILEIDPYVLGVWLGDGTKVNNCITTHKDDAQEMIKNLSSVKVDVREHSGNCVTLILDKGIRGKKGTSRLRTKLSSMGLKNKKHIPEEYFTASYNQRLELLRGLMDTDGNANSGGKCSFSNSNYDLARGVYRLVNSLGMKAMFNNKVVKLNGKEFFSYLVDFKGDPENPPFKLTRKIDGMDNRINDYQSKRKRVVSVEPIKSVKTSCIQVDREDGLYLVGEEDYVITHNSSIITFAKTIQDILIDPEITVGIFSFNRSVAKKFLNQIKTEFEQNELLKNIFDDIFYDNPTRESLKWSENDGIIVKRKGNPREATVEAHGLVDSQPTGRHFKLLVFDDVVTKDSVQTPDMSEKTTQAWEMALNLGTGDDSERRRYIGTRYHFNDTYAKMIERGACVPRIFTATDDGTMDGKSVFFSQEVLNEKKRSMGAKTFASQMLQDPRESSAYGFKLEWIRYWEGNRYHNMNKYILCDPANSKKKSSDYTVFWVIGLGADKNYYIIDCVRDKLNLTEKGNILFRLHQQYMPINVGYEKYGMQSDIEYFRERMSRENYRFGIVELGGTRIAKEERIERLYPILEAERLFFPERLIRTNWEGKTENLVEVFIQEEYLEFPFSTHDDMLDSLSRILDGGINCVFPSGNVLDPFDLGRNTEGIDLDYDPLNLW